MGFDVRMVHTNYLPYGYQTRIGIVKVNMSKLSIFMVFS